MFCFLALNVGRELWFLSAHMEHDLCPPLSKYQMSSHSSTQPTMWCQRQDRTQRSTLQISKVKHLRLRFKGHCDLFQHCPLFHPSFLSLLIHSSFGQVVWFNFCSELSSFSRGGGWHQSPWKETEGEGAQSTLVWTQQLNPSVNWKWCL